MILRLLIAAATLALEWVLPPLGLLLSLVLLREVSRRAEPSPCPRCQGAHGLEEACAALVYARI